MKIVRRKRVNWLFRLLVCFPLLTAAAGCSQLTPESISTDGSTSMEKVIGSLGEVWRMKHDDQIFTFNPTGSAAGIAAVKEGRCDIGLSSRNLTEEEKNSGLKATVLAYDGLAVIVHPSNPVADLDTQTIARIFTGKINNWEELGGSDRPVVRIGREASSGTREGFESALGIEDQCDYRQELLSSGDCIASVASNPNAIAYASVASIKKDNVKIVSVNGVLPEDEAIQEERYQLVRPFLLVTRQNEPLSGAAQLFYDYCLSGESEPVIAQAGVIPAGMNFDESQEEYRLDASRNEIAGIHEGQEADRSRAQSELQTLQDIQSVQKRKETPQPRVKKAA